MTDTHAKTSDELEHRYERDHSHPVNRALHMIGVPIIAASVPTLFFSIKWGLVLFAAGWVPNFVGHAVEGSLPVLLRNPRAVLLGAKHFGSELAARARLR